MGLYDDKKNINCGTRKNRGHESADLVISEPRNNTFSIVSELELFDFWILPRTKYHMSHCLFCTWYDTCLLYTSPNTHTAKNRKHA